MTKNEQLKRLTEQFLPAFLAFSIHRIGNFHEAEELAQEITFRAVQAIERGGIRENFDGYLWSIAHNTLKHWRGKITPLSLDDESSSLSNLLYDEQNVEDSAIFTEETAALRLALSRLAKNYRQVLVCFYYEERSIRETAQVLNLSEGMVKFYLRAGKQKLKEAMDMNSIGEKSFRPSKFSIYKNSTGYSLISEYDLFRRKLPCQIAIICRDQAKTIDAISLETGVPAVYVEEELQILLDADLMISPVKDKYRTNFHILTENAVAQVRAQFEALYEAYLPTVLAEYESVLPKMKASGVFAVDATPTQWAWYFAWNVRAFGMRLEPEDGPYLPAFGTNAYIYAIAAAGSPWACGTTPVQVDGATVCPCDVGVLGAYHRQNELFSVKKAQALANVALGKLDEADRELYAELIEQGYLVRQSDRLLCNIPIKTAKSRAIFAELNAKLLKTLEPLCAELRKNLTRTVVATLPEHLRDYAQGFSEVWIGFLAGVYFKEALCKKGFLHIPEADDNTPLACWIDLP